MNDWREAFIAMSTLLGKPESGDEIALRDQKGEPIDAIEIADLPLAAQLRDEDKTRRALSLARALGEIAIEIEKLEMEISF